MSFEVKVSRPQKPNGFLAPYPPPQPACPAGGPTERRWPQSASPRR
jgi:hypothetical protein